MDIDDIRYDNNSINKKLEQLHQIFCETIYDKVLIGENFIDDDFDNDDLIEAIKYFSEKEEYEKCIIIKKALNEKT